MELAIAVFLGVFLIGIGIGAYVRIDKDYKRESK